MSPASYRTAPPRTTRLAGIRSPDKPPPFERAGGGEDDLRRCARRRRRRRGSSNGRRRRSGRRAGARAARVLGGERLRLLDQRLRFGQLRLVGTELTRRQRGVGPLEVQQCLVQQGLDLLVDASGRTVAIPALTVSAASRRDAARRDAES